MKRKKSMKKFTVSVFDSKGITVIADRFNVTPFGVVFFIGNKISMRCEDATLVKEL